MLKTYFQSTLTATLSGLLVGLTGAAQAQPPSTSVEIVASPLRAVKAHEADDLKGLYFMSDGRRMRLNYRLGTIVADLDGEPVTELRALSARELRSSDGRMQMRFDVDSWRDRIDVTVTLLKGATMAQLTSAAIER